jgi:hypothetical protein
MACYVMNTSGDDNKGAEKCIIPLSDYLECLHHRKEVGKAISSCILMLRPSSGREGSADSGSISEVGGGKCRFRSEEFKGCEVVGRHCCNDGGEESPCAEMVTARQAELISEYTLPSSQLPSDEYMMCLCWLSPVLCWSLERVLTPLSNYGLHRPRLSFGLARCACWSGKYFH